MRRAGCIVGLLGWAVGCGGEEATPFPSDFAALEPMGVEAPPSGTEGANYVSGDTDGVAWAHAHARIGLPAEDVWAALQRPEVGVDRRRVDAFSHTELVDPGADVAYVVHTRVEELLTVEYDLTWRHLVIDGEVSAPESVAIRWQKTFGAAIIERIAGSVGVYAEGDETRLEVVEHLVTPGTTAVDAERFLRDLIPSVQAEAHGEPLPTY